MPHAHQSSAVDCGAESSDQWTKHDPTVGQFGTSESSETYFVGVSELQLAYCSVLPSEIRPIVLVIRVVLGMARPSAMRQAASSEPSQFIDHR
jgi:hypothetical protein